MGKILGQDTNKKVLELSIKQDLPVLLVGETGTGKTSIVRELAKEQKKKLIRVNLNGQTSTDEFVGHWLVKNGATYWQDGVLINAMKEGAWIILDEINACLPEILFVLQSLLDDDKSVLITENNAELVKPAKGFRFFATMNPSDEYAGTKELNKAFISRFPLILEFQYPDEPTEVKIIKSATKIKEQDASKWVKFFNHLRKMKANEDIFYTPSTRDLIYVGNLIAQGFTYKEAFEFAMLHRATNGDKDILKREFEKFFGEVFELEKKFGKDISEVLDEIKQKLAEQERKREILNDMEEMLKKLEEQAMKDIEKAKQQAEQELAQEAKKINELNKLSEISSSKEKKENKKKEKKSSDTPNKQDKKKAGYTSVSVEEFIKGVKMNKLDYKPLEEKVGNNAEPITEIDEIDEQKYPDSNTCSHACDTCPSKDTCMGDVKGVK